MISVRSGCPVSRSEKARRTTQVIAAIGKRRRSIPSSGSVWTTSPATHSPQKELQPMHTPLSALVLFAALSGGTRESTIYDDYKQAWRAGRAQNLPVLVILNPGGESEGAIVDPDFLRRSGHRRG